MQKAGPPSRREDLALVQACLERRPGAWERLTLRIRPVLFALARRSLSRCGFPAGSSEAEDLVQDVMACLLEGDAKLLRAYRGEASIEGYLGTVLVRRVLDRKRPPPSLSLEACAGLAAPSGGGETGDAELLEQRIRFLKPRAQMALGLLRRGLPHSEISQLLGMKEDAVAVLLSRAKAELREGISGTSR